MIVEYKRILHVSRERLWLEPKTWCKLRTDCLFVVFNEHKECLLRRDEDKIVIVEALQQQCRIDATNDSLCL